MDLAHVLPFMLFFFFLHEIILLFTSKIFFSPLNPTTLSSRLLHLIPASLFLPPLQRKTTAAASESGFPLRNTLSSLAACSLPSFPKLHLSLYFPLCVCLCRDKCVCERARAYTHPCVWEKMSVTGFEREHVCPGTCQTNPPYFAFSAPPLRLSALPAAWPTKCPKCPAVHFLWLNSQPEVDFIHVEPNKLYAEDQSFPG